MLGKGGGATSRADGQAIDGTGTSDSYEVTGLPGWLPHRTDRQVLDQDTAPKVEPGRASRGSDRCWWGPGIINGITAHPLIEGVEPGAMFSQGAGLDLHELKAGTVGQINHGVGAQHHGFA